MAAKKKSSKKSTKKKASSQAAAPVSAGSRAEMKRFEARQDLETLTRADEIRATPQRMSSARTEATRQQKATQRALKRQ